MKRIVVVRHGQSEADLLGVHEGRADFDLTSLGEKQVQQVAKWIKHTYPVDLIVSSPLKRAAHTATVIAEHTEACVIYDDDLMEWQNGLIAGLTFADASEKYPEVADKFPHSRFYGQESQIDIRMRSEAMLSKLLHEYQEHSTIVAVSHGGLIAHMFRSFLELPITSTLSIPCADTGVHEWVIKQDHKYSVRLNSVEYLSV